MKSECCEALCLSYSFTGAEGHVPLECHVPLTARRGAAILEFDRSFRCCNSTDFWCTVLRLNTAIRAPTPLSSPSLGIRDPVNPCHINDDLVWVFTTLIEDDEESRRLGGD